MNAWEMLSAVEHLPLARAAAAASNLARSEFASPAFLIAPLWKRLTGV